MISATKSRMKTIGLTGNIASGKSTVAAMLVARGAEHLDADRLVHELYRPGSALVDTIAARFGEGVVAADGSIDRTVLGRIVFGDASALADLEAIVHPYTTRLIAERMRAVASRPDPPPALVIEAVKLIEVGRHKVVDSLWFVVASPETQRKRLVEARGWRLEEANARLAAQAPLEPRLALADEVIRNDGTLQALEVQVAAAWQRLIVAHDEALC